MTSTIILICSVFHLLVPNESLEKVVLIHRSNFERIVQWSGESLVTSQKRRPDGALIEELTYKIVFRIDNSKNSSLVFAEMTGDHDSLPTWGELKTDNLYRRLEFGAGKNRMVRVQNAPFSSKSLTPLSFDPLYAFRWAIDDAEGVLSSVKLASQSAWGHVKLRTSEDLLILELGNTSLDCPPTKFMLASEKGGNLVNCYNPSPYSLYETKLDWMLLNEVWLPQSYSFRSVDGDGSSYFVVVEFLNQQVNQPIDQSLFSFGPHQLGTTTVVTDLRTGVTKVVSTQPTAQRNLWRSILRLAAVCSILLALVMAFRSRRRHGKIMV